MVGTRFYLAPFAPVLIATQEFTGKVESALKADYTSKCLALCSTVAQAIQKGIKYFGSDVGVCFSSDFGDLNGPLYGLA
jgi:hypothetical protein